MVTLEKHLHWFYGMKLTWRVIERSVTVTLT
jgi:hypothetical protein